MMDSLMDTHKKIREHISALVDGELSRDNLELAMAALQSADGRQVWHAYHRIGDALRAAPVAELSDNFGARLAARLAQEAAHGRKARTAGPGRAPRGGDKRAPGPALASAAHDPLAPAEAVAASIKPAIASVS
jgi:sigma-E factor negative regulatory protein RseA